MLCAEGMILAHQLKGILRYFYCIKIITWRFLKILHGYGENIFENECKISSHEAM